MAVPTRTEAVRLLLSLSPSERLLTHVTVVAEVAAFLAHRAGGRGHALDRRLVETAALLHDVDKALPAGDPVRSLGHGFAGARWVAERGHPEISRTIERHPVMRLAELEAEEWLRSGPLEERIVAYADKRATDRVRAMDERFERWDRRHPTFSAALATARERAMALEAGVCAAAGVVPGEVQRLRWVSDAIDRAGGRAALDLPPAGSMTTTRVPMGIERARR